MGALDKTPQRAVNVSERGVAIGFTHTSPTSLGLPGLARNYGVFRTYLDAGYVHKHESGPGLM